MVASGFLSVSGVQVLVVDDVQPALVVPQYSAERALRAGLFHVVLAPASVSQEQLLRGGMGDEIKADVARRAQEVQHVVVDVSDLRHVPLGALADRES